MVGRIILIATLMIGLMMPSVEARETFGVVDIVSRIDESMTNLDGEELNMFHSVTDVLIADLSPIVDVIDLTGEATAARLDELILQLNQGNCSELADAHCDYIIYGFLMNFNRSKGDRIAGKSEAVTADVSIRVVDARTGVCVFIAKSRGIAVARGVRVGPMLRIGSFEFSEEQLIDALEEAAHGLAAQLRENI